MCLNPNCGNRMTHFCQICGERNGPSTKLSQSFSLWTDQGLKRGTGAHKPISTLKKKPCQGMICQTFLKILTSKKKATATIRQFNLDTQNDQNRLLRTFNITAHTVRINRGIYQVVCSLEGMLAQSSSVT